MSKTYEENSIQDGVQKLRPSKLVAVLVVLIALTCTSSSVFAELRELKTFSLGPHRAGRIPFDRFGNSARSSMAVSASGDLFVLSVTPNGEWELSRIQDWSSPRAEISHLQLPGIFTQNDRHKFHGVDAQLLLTHDGRYAVCIGRADRTEKNRRHTASNSVSKNVITVVHVQNLTIEQTRRTSDLGLSEVQGFGITSDGRISVDGVTHTPKAGRVLISLDLPSLQAGPRCDYNRSAASPGDDAEPIFLTNESCTRASNPLSLEEGAAAVPSPALSGYTCGAIPERLCPQPDRLTPDQRFGIGLRTEGHDSMLGRWVWRGRSVAAYSTQTRSEIGEIDLMRNDVELRLSSLSGKDYLLILWPYSELAVYELREDES